MLSKKTTAYLFFIYIINIYNLFSFEGVKKTQDDFKNLLSYEINLDLNTINHIKSSSLLSSVISNFRKIKPSSFKKHGFKTILLKNKADYIRKIHLFSDDKKKPLIVFISGLSGTANSPSFNNFAYPLLKEKKYHIALIENSTSPEWISRNKNFLLSGCEAGLELLYTLQALKSLKDLKNKVEFMSLVGFSLGGNDSVFASFFDEKNKNSVIDGSIIVWSSPFERLNSLKYLRVKSGYYRWIVNKLLYPIFEKIDIVSDYFSSKTYDWFAHTGSFQEIYNNYLFKMNLNNFKALLQLYSSKDKIVINEEEYKNSYKLYSLLPYLSDIHRPILWVHAENDRIVENSFSFYNVYNVSNNTMDILLTPYGGHLGFYKTYGAQIIKKINEKYINYWGKTK